MSEEDAKAAKEAGLIPGDHYPRGAERDRISEGFDTLLAEIKTRETDAGQVALFNRTARFRPGDRPIPLDKLNRTVKRIVLKWNGDGEASVGTVARWTDLPAAIQEAAKEAGYDNASTEERIPGATFRGVVYLVHENITSEQLLEETLFHERKSRAVK